MLRVLPSRWLLIAIGGTVVLAGVLVLVLRPGSSSGTRLAERCPSKALVATTLERTITSATSSQLSYGDYDAPHNSGNRGTRLTCTYQAKTGPPIRFIVTSNAHVDAIVAAEEAGFGSTQTFSGGAGFEHQGKAPKVIGAFGKARIAWTLENGQILDALYGDNTNLLIIARGATKHQLEKLARSTFGTPQVNMRIDRST
jgi:hypothetical protein